MQITPVHTVDCTYQLDDGEAPLERLPCILRDLQIYHADIKTFVYNPVRRAFNVVYTASEEHYAAANAGNPWTVLSQKDVRDHAASAKGE